MQPSVSVCLSVFFFANATHPLGTPGPVRAGPRQLLSGSGSSAGLRGRFLRKKLENVDMT